jgi:hypothetical protein
MADWQTASRLEKKIHSCLRFVHFNRGSKISVRACALQVSRVSMVSIQRLKGRSLYQQFLAWIELWQMIFDVRSNQ